MYKNNSNQETIEASDAIDALCQLQDRGSVDADCDEGKFSWQRDNLTQEQYDQCCHDAQQWLQAVWA